MTLRKEQEKNQEVKLYKCQQCNKKVMANDYNFYFKICIKCENKNNHMIKLKINWEEKLIEAHKLHKKCNCW